MTCGGALSSSTHLLYIQRDGTAPAGIFGPVVDPNISASIAFVEQLLEGAPLQPGFYFGMVDVRDLADLHILAMTSDAAKDQRFLGVSGDVVSLLGIANIPKKNLGELVAKVQSPRTEEAAGATIRRSGSDKARRILGWIPRSQDETILDTAKSLVRHGVINQR